VRDNWDKITDFTGATYPNSISGMLTEQFIHSLCASVVCDQPITCESQMSKNSSKSTGRIAGREVFTAIVSDSNHMLLSRSQTVYFFFFRLPTMRLHGQISSTASCL